MKENNHDDRCAIDLKTENYKEGVNPDHTLYICSSCMAKAIDKAKREGHATSVVTK